MMSVSYLKYINCSSGNVRAKKCQNFNTGKIDSGSVNLVITIRRILCFWDVVSFEPQLQITPPNGCTSGLIVSTSVANETVIRTGTSFKNYHFSYG